ncbi:MAG: DNA double-strand break repair nuclease NurA [Candidatus Aenigmarchaeota archaeon]|nr:DNA double-strand break repair nuclease NurA [Candidatus Aenigmarchaeota archaeon]
MKDFIELTENLAKIVGEMERQRKNIGNFLRESSSLTDLELTEEILENKLIVRIPETDAHSFKVAGIDGGLLKKSFHGIDLMLLKAVGVIFSYESDKLVSTDYYPSSIPAIEPRTIMDPFNDIEFEINSNIERQIKEITTARETVEKFEPDILLLHGSVIPHYTFVPEKGSLLSENYRRMIGAYTELFEVIKLKKTLLAGVVEDSRGTRFCEMLNDIFLARFNPNIPPEMKIVLTKTKDSNLLSYVLEKGERSFVFPYSSKTSQHPILREFEVKDKIFTFYLKTVEFDRPIRVDFLGDKGVADKADFISSILLKMVGHSNYGIPSVLIEADQRAKLDENEIEMFYQDIMNKTGNISSLFEQRRNQRPF